MVVACRIGVFWCLVCLGRQKMKVAVHVTLETI